MTARRSPRSPGNPKEQGPIGVLGCNTPTRGGRGFVGNGLRGYQFECELGPHGAVGSSRVREDSSRADRQVPHGVPWGRRVPQIQTQEGPHQLDCEFLGTFWVIPFPDFGRGDVCFSLGVVQDGSNSPGDKSSDSLVTLGEAGWIVRQVWRDPPRRPGCASGVARPGRAQYGQISCV